MATWIVDNDTTTPVSGETNVAQAVAEAQNGDTIVIQGFATAGLLDIGKSLTIEGSPTFGGELATSQITVEAGANVTFAYLEISGGGGGSGSGLKGADGADSTAVGANGVDGTAFTGQPGSKGGDGGNGDAGSDAAPIVGVAGGAIVNDGALTIVDSVVIGLSFSGKSGGKGGNGGAGAPGGYGGSGGGTSTPGGNGGNGADGGAGGSGGAGAAGANGGGAVGGIDNKGSLTLENSAVTGSAFGGAGGKGGNGGAGAQAGYGGNGGFTTMNATGATPGKGGNGGNGGDGGSGGAGGDGGSAVGGVYNEGSLAILGAAVLYDDSATGGQGGAGGAGAPGGAGGAFGVGGDFLGTGLAGAAGTAGSDGASGASGSAYADFYGAGPTAGAFTIGSSIIASFVAEPETVTDTNTNFGQTFTYHLFTFGADGASGSVSWHVTTGAGGPPLGDFSGATSGTFNYNSLSGITFAYGAAVTLKADAAAPAIETFSIELTNPTGSVKLGDLTTITQSVINAAANTISDLTSLSYKTSYEAVWTVSTGVLQIVDTAASNAVVATLTFPNADLSGELISLSDDGSGGTKLKLASAPIVSADPGSVVAYGVPGAAYNAVETLADGAKAYFFTNVAGQPYTARRKDVDAHGLLVDQVFTGVTGQGFLTSYKYLYAGGGFVGAQDFYTGVTGQAYTAEEADYDGAGRLTRAAFSGVSGQPYAAYEYDYVGGVFSGSMFTYTTAPSGAAYSSYEVDYDNANAFAGEKFFFTGVTGQDYTGEEADFDASGQLSRIVLTGFQDQAYSSLQLDYSAGAYQGYKAFYNVMGQSYTSEEVDVSASGALEKVVYSGLTGTPYASVEQDYSNGSVSDLVYDFTNVTGGNYHSYQIVTDANGVAQRETFDLDSGGHTLIALASGQTLTSLGDDKMTGSGATTFLLDASYGADTITNFNSGDKVSLSSAEYAQLSPAIQNGTYSGGNATLHFSDGDTLTFKGMTEATLSGMTANFMSHA